jgi:hypothetical protein
MQPISSFPEWTVQERPRDGGGVILSLHGMNGGRLLQIGPVYTCLTDEQAVEMRAEAAKEAAQRNARLRQKRVALGS